MQTLENLPECMQISLLGDQVHLLTKHGKMDAEKLAAVLKNNQIDNAVVTARRDHPGRRLYESHP